MKMSLNKQDIKKLIKTGILITFIYGGIIYLFLSFVSTIVSTYQ